MRLAYVCADSGIPLRGHKGASVHVRSITQGLAELGHEILLCCATEGSGNPAPDRVAVRVLGGPAMTGEALEALFGEYGVQAVIERYSLETAAARRASAGLGLPLVLEVNAPIVVEAARHRGLQDVPAALERERTAFRSADAIIAVSQALVAYVAGVAPAAAVHWVPNGADLARFAGARGADLGLPRGSLALGFVGSMKSWHGVQDLLTAFTRIMGIHPEAHLVLVGEGPEAGDIRARVLDEDLGGRVHLLGARPHQEIPGVLASLDVAVAPYRPSDDFYFSPMKVVEYLAAGLPVAYPTLGDLPALVGSAGLGYPPGSIGSLADALATLCGSEGLRRRLAAEAMRRSRSHSWGAVASATEAIVRAELAPGLPAGAR